MMPIFLGEVRENFHRAQKGYGLSAALTAGWCRAAISASVSPVNCSLPPVVVYKFRRGPPTPTPLHINIRAANLLAQPPYFCDPRQQSGARVAQAFLLRRPRGASVKGLRCGAPGRPRLQKRLRRPGVAARDAGRGLVLSQVVKPRTAFGASPLCSPFRFRHDEHHTITACTCSLDDTSTNLGGRARPIVGALVSLRISHNDIGDFFNV